VTSVKGDVRANAFPALSALRIQARAWKPATQVEKSRSRRFERRERHAISGWSPCNEESQHRQLLGSEDSFGRCALARPDDSKFPFLGGSGLRRNSHRCSHCHRGAGQAFLRAHMGSGGGRVEVLPSPAKFAVSGHENSLSLSIGTRNRSIFMPFSRIQPVFLAGKKPA